MKRDYLCATFKWFFFCTSVCHQTEWGAADKGVGSAAIS